MMARFQILPRFKVLWPYLVTLLAAILIGSLFAILEDWVSLAFAVLVSLLIVALRGPSLFVLLSVAFLLVVNPVYANYMPAIVGVLTKEILLAISFLVWLVHVFKSRKGIFKYRAELMLIPFAAYTLVNAVFHRGFSGGVLAWRTTALYAFMYFVIRDLFSREKAVSRYLSLLRAAAIVTVIIQTAQFLFPSQVMSLMGWQYGVDQAWRESGFGLKAPGFATASHTGLFLAVVLTMEFGEAIQNRHSDGAKPAVGKLLLLTLLLGGILLTASRGTFVGLTIGISYLILRSRTASRVKALVFLLLGGLLSILIFRDYWFEVVGSVWGRTSSALLKQSNLLRFRIYLSMLQSFLDAPLFGNGLALAGEIKLADLRGIVIEHPHSYVLKLLAQTGVIGFGLWITMNFSMLFRATHSIAHMTKIQWKAKSISLVGGLITLLGCNVFNEVLEDPAINVLFWSLLGILYALIGMQRRAEVS
jgi:hypothetical protein